MSDFQSCYDPQSVTSPKESASYELDKAYLTIWKVWNKYEQLWRGRLNKLEATRFDIRRVTQSTKMTEDETLFVCLGLSPSVFGTPHFRPLSLYEKNLLRWMILNIKILRATRTQSIPVCMMKMDLPLWNGS